MLLSQGSKHVRSGHCWNPSGFPRRSTGQAMRSSCATATWPACFAKSGQLCQRVCLLMKPSSWRSPLQRAVRWMMIFFRFWIRGHRNCFEHVEKSQGRSKKQEQEKQQLIHAEVAEQREAVTAAQWAWFQAALKQDQQMLEKLQVVPALVKSKLHTKAVSKRREQAAAGEKATKGYQDRGLPERVESIFV